MRIRKFNEAQFSDDDSEENGRTAEERHRNRMETRRVLRHAALDAVNNNQRLSRNKFEHSIFLDIFHYIIYFFSQSNFNIYYKIDFINNVNI